ncbi:MAG TPA: response regulator [Bryobacteraceae bacterium]|jgi:FixJ family two-component response regulator|nr:response regulator [Bryobacteraceae bacterium]
MGSETTGRLIGIVEDDVSVRVSVDSLLRSAGYKTALFASAEDLLNSDQLHALECLIVDIELPGMSGLELQKLLVAAELGAPVLVVSSHAELGARALEQGALAALPKPIRGDALLEAIERALRESRGSADNRPGPI